jgi:hypothetical protein
MSTLFSRSSSQLASRPQTTVIEKARRRFFIRSSNQSRARFATLEAESDAKLPARRAHPLI